MPREESARVYIGNLGSNGVKSELEREFAKFGSIKDVWVARNPPGFAFVEFHDHRDAEDAVRELDGRRICGVPVRVEISTHKGRSSRMPPPSYRGRPRYSPDRYGGRSYNDDYGDRYSRRSPPRRRYDRSPETDRYQRRYSRSRSRSPPSRY
ncbi:serine/arginine-rich splicing factor 3-like [Actinia tenebrosa]|uniref:Serine/arginine-rich splicing factor 3-like n=1 Tax=Actinia tenebrosa TaxID=6105 RepID=A0A6P8IYP0_ACTTE|nr:serine/arginine-rich splicing factor 3-like [Actinia tenebrosa]